MTSPNTVTAPERKIVSVMVGMGDSASIYRVGQYGVTGMGEGREDRMSLEEFERLDLRNASKDVLLAMAAGALGMALREGLLGGFTIGLEQCGSLLSESKDLPLDAVAAAVMLEVMRRGAKLEALREEIPS